MTIEPNGNPNNHVQPWQPYAKAIVGAMTAATLSLAGASTKGPPTLSDYLHAAVEGLVVLGAVFATPNKTDPK